MNVKYRGVILITYYDLPHPHSDCRIPLQTCTWLSIHPGMQRGKGVQGEYSKLGQNTTYKHCIHAWSDSVSFQNINEYKWSTCSYILRACTKCTPAPFAPPRPYQPIVPIFIGLHYNSWDPCCHEELTTTVTPASAHTSYLCVRTMCVFLPCSLQGLLANVPLVIGYSV